MEQSTCSTEEEEEEEADDRGGLHINDQIDEQTENVNTKKLNCFGNI